MGSGLSSFRCKETLNFPWLSFFPDLYYEVQDCRRKAYAAWKLRYNDP